MDMKKIKTVDGYDVYVGEENGEKCYALRKEGSTSVPVSGYYWGSSAVMMNHVEFGRYYQSQGRERAYDWAVEKSNILFGEGVK